MPDIYNILEWNSSTVYSKNNTVKYSNDYFYSSVNNNSNNTPVYNSNFWNGLSLDPIDNSIKPNFAWLPSYGVNIDISPRMQKITFGAGYAQIIPDSINNQLLRLELQFNGRDLDEAQSIIHFLSVRNGATFLYTPSPPFGKRKRFKCLQFPVSLDFYNNYNISALFEETPV